jgi:MtN3 and saliva related transmembrane protein
MFGLTFKLCFIFSILGNNSKKSSMIEQIIGYSGALISSISFLPQVIKLWKTKSGKDLSMVTLSFLTLNALLWAVYGVMKDAKPLWITNVLMLIMLIVMIFLKIKYRKN